MGSYEKEARWNSNQSSWIAIIYYDITKKIQEWIYKCDIVNGDVPRTIPLTRIEIAKITEECEPFMMNVPVPSQPSKLLNIEIDETVYAEWQRENILKIPLTQFITQYSMSDVLHHNTQTYKSDFLFDSYKQIYKTWLLSDKTKVEVEFEWDMFAGLKKLLHITRWFPVKTRKRIINCTVLYPYCKVTFPHNKQVVHFK